MNEAKYKNLKDNHERYYQLGPLDLLENPDWQSHKKEMQTFVESKAWDILTK